VDSSSTFSFEPLPGTGIIQHRHHVLQIAAFLLGAVLIDRGLGGLLKTASTRIVHGECVKHVNAAPACMDRGIVVFGNSRAAHHVDQQLLSAQTGLTAYNAGSNGQGIHFHRTLQELLLQSPARPRLFVLQVDALEFITQSPPDRALVLAPFMDRSAAARCILLKCDPRAWIKQCSLTWRFNSQIHDVARSLMTTVQDVNQFRPLKGAMDELRIPEAARRMRKKPTIKLLSPAETASVLELYREFIHRARENGIEVVLLVCPRLLRRTELENKATPLLRKLVAEEGVTLLQFDEDNHPEFRDPTAYCDIAHLNNRGAALLTSLLSGHIRNYPPERGHPSAGWKQLHAIRDDYLGKKVE